VTGSGGNAANSVNGENINTTIVEPHDITLQSGTTSFINIGNYKID